jgi:manganese/zinc/iron transport system ATP- binding protein
MTKYKDQPALSVKNISVAYHRELVLHDVSMEIPHGVLMAVVGPNGAGKSTLIQSILGFIKPVTGSVTLNGQPVGKARSTIGYVPQRSSVDWDFPTTVLDTVLMGTYRSLGWFRRPGEKERNQAMESLEKVGMDAFSHRHISELSGGQQQRVFLARALVQDTDMYLMDEPLQGVDAATEKTIIGLLKQMKKQGKTIVVVHHDLQSLPHYFEWAALLNRELIGYGPMDKVLNEKNIHKTYAGYVVHVKKSD